MRTTTVPITLLAIASCVSYAMPAVGGDPTESPAVPAMRFHITLELDAVKALAEQLSRRVLRLEALLELDRAKQARNAAQESWRRVYYGQRDTADFIQKDAEARELYFKTLAPLETARQQFLKLENDDL